jgi:hypothetical protein
MDEDYDMSKLHVYLDRTEQAFEDFKKLAKDKVLESAKDSKLELANNGLIISGKTLEQLKKDYNIDIESCKITYVRLENEATSNSPEKSIPIKPEYIMSACEHSYTVKKPILIQGIERLAHRAVPTAIDFLYILSEKFCANLETPILIPMNKSFYINEGLEMYLKEYVEVHKIEEPKKLSLLERIWNKIRGQ